MRKREFFDKRKSIKHSILSFVCNFNNFLTFNIHIMRHDAYIFCPENERMAYSPIVCDHVNYLRLQLRRCWSSTCHVGGAGYSDETPVVIRSLQFHLLLARATDAHHACAGSVVNRGVTLTQRTVTLFSSILVVS